MYHQYFGLSEPPFSIAVNPRYLFMSPRHRDALAHLLYGVGTGGGFILLTGEVGTGKTTINRCLLEQLPEDTDIAIILNPALSAVELLASACDELGIDYGGEQHSLKVLTDKLHAFLLDNHSRGRKTVLLIDEAQHLDFDVLEQIRLLTNLETNSEKLLQIILIGQPELRQKLWDNVAYMQKLLGDAEVPMGDSTSHVIPIMVRDDARVFQMGEEIFREGVFINPVKYPAVGKHKSRFRMSISAAHTREDLEEGAVLRPQLLIGTLGSASSSTRSPTCMCLPRFLRLSIEL